MFRGGWRYVLAAFCGLIISGVGFWLVVLAYDQPQNSADYANAAAQQREPSQDPLARAVGKLPSPYHDEDYCENTEARNGPDLCAQWVAANAARDAAVIGERTFYLNIFGLIALVATLVATAWAAWAATKAAQATSDAMEKFIESEEGAISFSADYEEHEKSGALFINFGLLNPSKNHIIVHYVDIGENSPLNGTLTVPIKFGIDPLRTPPTVIKSGETLKLPHGFESKHGKVIYGGVIYSDVFGEFKIGYLGVKIENHFLEMIDFLDFSLWCKKRDEIAREHEGQSN